MRSHCNNAGFPMMDKQLFFLHFPNFKSRFLLHVHVCMQTEILMDFCLIYQMIFLTFSTDNGIIDKLVELLSDKDPQVCCLCYYLDISASYYL